MAYSIAFEPLNRIHGVTPTTVEIETAGKAWIEVYGLMQSDERVTIKENGRSITWEQLRDTAKREAS